MLPPARRGIGTSDCMGNAIGRREKREDMCNLCVVTVNTTHGSSRMNRKEEARGGIDRHHQRPTMQYLHRGRRGYQTITLFIVCTHTDIEAARARSTHAHSGENVAKNVHMYG